MSVLAYAPYGADGVIIRVEADIRRGIPGIDISGLAEGAVREARERVRAAFRNSGFSFPLDRILINLAPAGLRKYGAGLDLPIALAVMTAAGLVSAPSNLMVMGELELSGRVRPVRGVLAAIAAGLALGPEEKISGFIVPQENQGEAFILGKKSSQITAVSTLREAYEALASLEETGSFPKNSNNHSINKNNESIPLNDIDFADVRGQSTYKRALEIAAAGGHNMLVFGPPGAGKTMLARRLPSIMPLLSFDEAVEVTKLHSLAGRFRPEECLITHPPFRTPHHSASAEGILGGGKSLRPGEISLAHFGVLFLDEAPEFKANVLQALREPLEDRVISIARADGVARLPAEFQLLLAANACPCGRLGMNHRENDYSQGCMCSPQEINGYWKKFGGALLDRIELRTAVIPPGTNNILGSSGEESSAKIAKRINAAVSIQKQRYKSIRRNALIPAGTIEKLCPLSEGAQAACKKAAAFFGFSGRAYHGVLRVARTIADLEGKEVIDTDHVLEAVEHRRYGEDPYEIVTLK